MDFSVGVATASLGSVVIHLTLSLFRKRRNQSNMKQSVRQVIGGSGDM